jgi:hypothetical protein
MEPEPAPSTSSDLSDHQALQEAIRLLTRMAERVPPDAPSIVSMRAALDDAAAVLHDLALYLKSKRSTTPERERYAEKAIAAWARVAVAGRLPQGRPDKPAEDDEHPLET